MNRRAIYLVSLALHLILISSVYSTVTFIKPRQNFVKLFMNGSFAQLDCLATSNIPGVPVLYKWVRESVAGNLDSARISQFENGSLIIRGVQSNDEDMYRCWATDVSDPTNGLKSPIVGIQVLVKPYITKGPGYHSLTKGSVLKLQCLGGGTLSIYWSYFVNGVQVRSKENNPVSVDVAIYENSTIECRLRNEYGNASKMGYVFVWGGTTVARSTSPPAIDLTCTPYTGQECSSYFPPNYYWRRDTTQPRELSDKETGLRDVFARMKEGSSKGQPGEPTDPALCRDRLKRLACAAAFPRCNRSTDQPGAKAIRVCREHCTAVKDLFCERYWLDLQSRFEKLPESPGMAPVHQILTKGCSHLPHLNPEMRSLVAETTNPVCRQVDLEPELSTTSPRNFTNLCYYGRGQFYLGNQSIILENARCLPWSKVASLNMAVSPFAFPSLFKAGRQCRNPGGVKSAPFCIPDNPTLRREQPYVVCAAIPDCLAVVTAPVKPIGNKDRNIWIGRYKIPVTYFIIAVVVASVLLLLLLLTTIYCCCRQRLRGSKCPVKSSGCMMPLGGSASTSMELNAGLRQKLTVNQLFQNKSVTDFLHPKLEKLEYPRNNLVDIQDLGRGAFGEVILAEAPNLPRDLFRSNSMEKRSSGGEVGDTGTLGAKKCLVAVKVLGPEASDEVQISFLKEAELLAEFEHPNVIKLLGICAASKPICLLLEYMRYGDLNSFLRRHHPDEPTSPSRSPHHQETSFINGSVQGPRHWPLIGGGGKTDENRPLLKHGSIRSDHFDHSGVRMVDKYRLTEMAINVAEAMAYISNNGYVHRDLATRNCLVAESMTVKISDFGLCRPVKLGTDFIGDDSECVPIRWLPLESISENRYNLDSDVWSFGILLYELFTFADLPYGDLSHEEVIDFLQKECILTRPKRCPEAVYSIMQRCWSSVRRDRPNFSWLLGQLKELLRRWREESNLKGSTSDTYT